MLAPNSYHKTDDTQMPLVVFMTCISLTIAALEKASIRKVFQGADFRSASAIGL